MTHRRSYECFIAIKGTHFLYFIIGIRWRSLHETRIIFIKWFLADLIKLFINDIFEPAHKTTVLITSATSEGSGKLDKNALIRKWYNRIPYPALNTKRERDTYNYRGTKIKTVQLKSQRDSSFQSDGHKAILNKFRQTDSGRMLTIRINHNRSIALERPAINYWWLKPILRCSNLNRSSAVVHIHIEVVRSAWMTSTY